MTDLSGQTYGNYRLDASLGAGALAEVYRAMDERTGRTIALKVFRDDLCAEPNFTARFLALAPTLATVGGPHVVPTLDWGAVAGRCFLALPLLVDGSLRQRLHSGGGGDRSPVHVALDLVAQAASGVADIHRHGLVHGDLRPENLLIERRDELSDRIQVADYGLLGLIEGRPLVGAPAYMAPERFGGQVADGRGDIYALGVILYEVLTGAQPFATASFSDAASLHARLALVPPRELRPELPPTIEAIVLRCLANDPAARYASAAALAADLRATADELRPRLPGTDTRGTPPEPQETVAQAEQPQAPPIALHLSEPGTLSLTPGEPATLHVTATNRGLAPAALTLTVEGASASWVVPSVREIEVAPGGSERVALTITVAREPHSSAGEYPVTLRATPRDGQGEGATVGILWVVRPFTEGALTLIPSGSSGQGRATYTLQVDNRGNAPLRRALTIRAAAPLVGLLASETVDLDPGTSATVALTISAPRHTFGRARRRSFTVEALSSSAETLTARGSITQRPRILPWLLSAALGALALVLAAVGTLTLRPEMLGSFVAVAPAPTANVVAQAEPTMATEAADIALAPTSAPIATATVPGRTVATAATPAPLALSASSLSFGTVPVGGNAVQNIQVRNTTARALTFRRIQIDGTDAGDFTRAGPCGLEPLGINLTCPLTVIFSPSSGGNRTARLTITLADGAAQVVTLGGIATAPAIGTPQIAPPARPVPPLAGARAGHAAATLAEGRKLIVAGGRNGPNSLKSVEIYDLATNVWVGGRDMGEARAGHTATTLSDGMVVILGGRGAAGVLKSAEVYDPATQGWSPFPALTTAREGHTTTLLSDGRTRGYRLLVLGGRGQDGTVLTSGETYDSNTRTWTETPGLLADGRADHTATLLKGTVQDSPRVLLVGGRDQGNRPAPARLFDPLGNEGSQAVPDAPGELLARVGYTATLVEATGQVLFIGGMTDQGGVAAITVYDPAAPPESAWREGDVPLPVARVGHTATLLPYGRILLTGGGVGPRETASTELFDPARLASPQP